MDFPKQFNSKSGEINFQFMSGGEKLSYVSGAGSNDTSHFVLVFYLPETKIFGIKSINKGKNGSQISRITEKTLEAAIENFDIEEIKFLRIREERTLSLFEDYKQETGSIIEIPNYSNSPFLRSLEMFGFNRYQTNIPQDLMSTSLYYLSAYKSVN